MAITPAAAPARKPVSKPVAAHRPATARPVPKAGVARSPVKAAAPNPNAFIQYINTGKAAYEAGHYKQAEADLKKSLALGAAVMPPHHKNMAIIHNLLGLVQMKLKQYPASAASLKQAIAIYKRPENSGERTRFLTYAYTMLGQMAMFDGRFQEAQTYYRLALPEAQALADTTRVQEIQKVLQDIEHIDAGPDYLSAVSAHVTRWSHPNQPIVIYIADGASLPDWRASNQALAQSAFMEWQQAMGVRLRFEFTDNPQLADIQVNWVNLPMENTAEQQASGHAELRNGLCRTQVMNQLLFKDDISIVTHHTDGKAYSDDVIYNTLLHEIGHAIGLLNGHSPTPGDALFSSNLYEDGRRKHLTERDIITAHKLYDLPAEITNPPGIHLVPFSQYVDLRVNASSAYNRGDYTVALNQFQRALSLYGQESEIRFWTGMAAWKLNQYDQAAPYLMAAANQPGTYQGEALRMAGSSFILSGQRDEKSYGNSQLAEQKYRSAYQLLSQRLPHTPMTPENAKGIQDTLSWLNQRLAMGSPDVIQWAGGHPGGFSSETSGKKKKRGWFASLFEPAPYTNQVPVQIMMPGGRAGY
ncbi:tetratricopeptide repeat protein [Vampirovibrio sp.]|uniref:tetratricopeptide repeat protein n=1 Tax=Vampirovibrio sp. TaxID=2717857 RepID=UPI00359374A4